ncbi:MAG: glycosyltransferase family 2 protein [Chthoniobacterales bacterium]
MSHSTQGGLIAALIPAFQEESFIHEVVRRTLPFVDKVLVVDDGCTDATLSEARRAGAEVISHLKNLGKGQAIKTGLKHLSGTNYYHVIILDGDLQHVPEEIGLFVEKIREADPAMIVGSRARENGEMPFVRKCTNQFMSGLISLVCGQRIPDSQCGFRSMRADVIDLIRENCHTSGYDFESEMLLVVSRQGHRILSVPVSTVYGTEVSKIRPVPDTIRFFKLILRYLFFRKSRAFSAGKEVSSAPAIPEPPASPPHL